jgi:uncharacterized protein YjbJ (UPF0337 family)
MGSVRVNERINQMTNSPTWNKVQGNWKQFKGSVQSRWGKLTNDEVDQMNGEREQLAGKIQEKYGIAQEEANKQIDEWADKLKA